MKETYLLKRFLALIIDGLVLVCAWVMVCVASIAGHNMTGQELSFAHLCIITCIVILSCLAIFLFYFVYLTMGESSTIGKKLMGITVVTHNGLALSTFRSFIRCLAFTIFLPLWFISLIVALCVRGRTLHDIVAGTRVIKEGI